MPLPTGKGEEYKAVMTSRPAIRFPLMAVSMIALLAGMWAGLLRLGWAVSMTRTGLLVAHGPLMVSGFLGTLISLERAVALGRRWPYAAPVLTALGALGLLLDVPAPIASAAITLGSVLLLATFVIIIRTQPALFTVTMGVGVVAWVVGNALWLAGWPVFEVTSWWLGFLVLTIAGERLELSRLLPRSAGNESAFLILVVVLWAGLSVGGFASADGARVTGIALLALTVWLLRHDVARRTVKQAGLTRFVAVCLLSGYVWLGVGGLLSIIFGRAIAGLQYDAVLHAVFLGFVFAMIFGHAPIIFPAVLGLQIPFGPAFYAHLALLHLSLVLRIGGDLSAMLAVRQWGGVLNVAAVLFFLANTAYAVRQGRRTVMRPAAPIARPSDAQQFAAAHDRSTS